jgi:hypothetical protein
MILNATIKKDPNSKWWCVEITELRGATQGKDLYDAVDMGIDLIRCMADDDKLPVGAKIILRETPLFRYDDDIQVTDTCKKVEFTVEPNEELVKLLL